MWRLGGLSPAELLKRAARETWQDDIFGLSARLAFYYFLAIFPVLTLLLVPLARLESGAEMQRALAGAMRQFLPSDAAELVAAAMRDLHTNARESGIVLAAVAGAIWAGINASWAMIAGLNTAYETEEDRSFPRLTARAGCLALAVAALVMAALLVTHYLGREVRAARFGQWAATIVFLMLSLALFYRYGPNLKQQSWQWSTPGAVFATALWVGSTFAVQFYFDRLAGHDRIYGRLAAVAALLIWLYMTSAAVLIGAEVNSEIEKAGEQTGARGSIRKRSPRR